MTRMMPAFLLLWIVAAATSLADETKPDVSQTTSKEFQTPRPPPEDRTPKAAPATGVDAGELADGKTLADPPDFRLVVPVELNALSPEVRSALIYCGIFETSARIFRQLKIRNGAFDGVLTFPFHEKEIPGYACRLLLCTMEFSNVGELEMNEVERHCLQPRLYRENATEPDTSQYRIADPSSPFRAYFEMEYPENESPSE